MIDEVRVAIVQSKVEQAIYDPEERKMNTERIVEKINQLGKSNDLLVFPEIARILAVKGSEMIVFISSWGTAGNIRLYGKCLPVARALENQAHVVFCNDVSDVVWKKLTSHHYGESKIVSSTGEIVVESATDQEEVITGRLVKSELEKGASILSVFRDRRLMLWIGVRQQQMLASQR